MKLQYRGINYESQSAPIPSNSSKITAKFRGLIYYLKHPLTRYLHSVRILRYRGKNYIKTDQVLSSPDHELYSDQKLYSEGEQYSIHEDAKEFIKNLNKFNL